MSIIINRNSFTITVDGDSLSTIHTLLDALAYFDKNVIDDIHRHHLCNLIASMLPNEGQIINEEDAELLEKVKQNQAAVDAIIQDTEPILRQ